MNWSDQLQGRLPLPIPAPQYQARDPQTGALQFMGYAMLPGEPLWYEAWQRIGDEPARDRIAEQLAGFLRTLHSLPATHLPVTLPVSDTPENWADLHRQFQAQLYPFMRPDARTAVNQAVAELLLELRARPFQPALRHGDFGTGNLLFDPHSTTMTGIIDFGFAGAGDPALDVASLLAGYGEPFIMRCAAFYPAMEQMLPRARQYQRTFALQQALYALRDGNREDFEDGIAAYV